MPETKPLFEPWTVEAENNRLGYEVRDSRGATVADVCGSRYAHLMAAAPELLEACRAAEKFVCKVIETWKQNDAEYPCVEERRLLGMLLSAIAKAEGRSC